MADQRIKYDEYMIGAGHPTLQDTLNRHANVEHNPDGTHSTIPSLNANILAVNNRTLLAGAIDDLSTALQIQGNESISGNLTFTGNGAKIFGNFSDSTLANRTSFQNGSTNTNTIVSTCPNGINTISAFKSHNSSDIANSSYLALQAQSTSHILWSGKHGTGVFAPFLISVDGTTAMFITASLTSTQGNNPLVLIGAISSSDTVAKLQVTGITKQSTYTVATLPTGTAGCRSFVTDSNTTLVAGHGNIVLTGGANFVPVYHDGTNWRIG